MTYDANTAVILVAAGRGSRMGGDVPKQWRMLAGQPVLAHTIQAFQAAGLRNITLVVHPDDRERAEAFGLPMVEGGDSRTQSVRAALEALAQTAPAPQYVLIHDGARPLVSAELIRGVCDALTQTPAAAPALPVTDALWRGENGYVIDSHPRDGLFRAQTPQGFGFDTILTAHRSHQGDAADDVEIARAAGHLVTITQGCENNLKLTYPQDFERAERLLSKGERKGQTLDIRTGTGYDVHAFTEGDHVILCGCPIPHDKALLGHSDADVGMHALTDAIYGALAEGDIGRHFPPSDPQWKGAASDIFLRHAVELAQSRGFALSNVDVTLVCERPKIGPHADAMREKLSQIMGVELGRISVKATTSERLGFTGREEGIASIATATLVKS